MDSGVAYDICNSRVANVTCDSLNCARFLIIFSHVLFYKLIFFLKWANLPKHSLEYYRYISWLLFIIDY